MANTSELPLHRAAAVSTSTTSQLSTTSEGQRVSDNASGRKNWHAWGPYLSERQWGTVREDYSAHGTAWDYFPHDMARSRAYRWGEDGLAGLSDETQKLCLALGLWNGADPIIKERLFGLTNAEGNHGEDVKEIYYYLDATPSHSYLKMLYKYPQVAFPYGDIVAENRRRGMDVLEYEVIDTGVFNDDRYFDIFVEYAQAEPGDILMRVRVVNRGPEEAALCVLPQLWFRNTWSWYHEAAKPGLFLDGPGVIAVGHPDFPGYRLYYETSGEPVFTENQSNPRLWGESNASGYYKDGINDYIAGGEPNAVNPDYLGTKAAVIHRLLVPAGASHEIRVRLSPGSPQKPFADFDDIFTARLAEADDYYAALQQGIGDDDQRNVQRQAFAGLMWTKQFFYFDVKEWLDGDPAQMKPPAERHYGRNRDWIHLNNADIISMPDTWEYPWYAAWDLAFHCLPLALIDAHFAKKQLDLITREWYMHPNGQIPAYEWNFSDVNPPVHAWATWRVFQIDREQRGDDGDLAFLESVFHKLMLNFTWWVNRKDREGRNIFQGGFLGLDNIGVFDRSAYLPTGGYINQSDGTSWMAMYSLNLMRIALELAKHNPVYENIASKFFEHFLHIAAAMSNLAGEGLGLWDEQDQFYYDVLNVGDEHGCHRIPMRLRNLVGLIPLFAVEVIEPELLERVPGFRERLEWMLENRPDLAALVSRWYEPGRGERRLLSLLRGHRMKKILLRMLDESEFFSDYGIRGISKHHEHTPYALEFRGQRYEVPYTPAESNSGLFGGNSNWRGPIWMPINYLLVESLHRFHHYYGDEFKVECPTGSGNYGTIRDAADELSQRLVGIFARDQDGKRPVYGHSPRMQNDPHFRDYILFYEYFHGDTGRGVGASHQTGWTALVAQLLQQR
ncbi:MAG: glucosidase [Proteobacteria bacterium]|nr:glucosidase [Pseudomonadota bacterium]